MSSVSKAWMSFALVASVKESESPTSEVSILWIALCELSVTNRTMEGFLLVGERVSLLNGDGVCRWSRSQAPSTDEQRGRSIHVEVMPDIIDVFQNGGFGGEDWKAIAIEETLGMTELMDDCVSTGCQKYRETTRRASENRRCTQSSRG